MAQNPESNSAMPAGVGPSPERILEILQKTSAAICVFRGVDFVFEFTNAEYRKIVGNRDYLGRKLLDVVPEIRDQPIYQSLLKVMSSGQLVSGQEEPVHLMREGGQLGLGYFDFYFEPYFDENGLVAGVVETATDVTAQVLARQKVESLKTIAEVERANFRNLFMQTPEMVCILHGPNHVFEFVNQAHIRALGFDATGMSVLQAQPESVEVHGLLDEVYQTGKTAELREIPVTVSDRVRYFNLTYSARRDVQGQINGVMILGVEITDQVLLREKMRHSEDRLELALKGSNLGLWEWIIEADELKFDDQTLRVFGLTRETFEGNFHRDFPKVLHPDERARVNQAVEDAVKNHTSYDITYRVIWPDGTLRWVLARGRAHYSLDDGRPYRMIGTVLDITDLKNSEVKLARSKDEAERFSVELEKKSALLQTIIEQMPMAVVIAEAPSGKLIFANQQIKKVWRHDFIRSSDVRGYVEYIGFHPDGRRFEGRDWPLARAIEKGETVLGEDIDVLRGDGSRGILRISAAPVRNSQGEMIAGVVLSEDVTEQRKAFSYIEILSTAGAAFAEARDISSLLRALTKISLPTLADWQCVDHLDERGRPQRVLVQHADREKAHLTAELLKIPTAPDSLITKVVQSQKPILVESLAPSDLTEESAHFGPHSLRSRQIARELGVNSFMIIPFFAKGKLQGTVCFCVGNSGRRYFEHDLQFAKDLVARYALAYENIMLIEDANRASQLKSAFLANMSHEIRTPLGAILGFTELLRDSALQTEEKKSYLDIISRNGEQLTSIINDVLDLSKIEAGQVRVEILRIAPFKVIEEALTVLSIRAREKKLALNCSFDSSVPQEFGTDPTRLKQIVLNIVGNAIKFTKQGQVKVLVSYRQDEGKAGFLTIDVEDTGVGISEEQEQRLFRPFSQADESVTRKFGGTGLGLSLSRKLAEAIGGEVRLLRSQPNAGSVFRIQIENRLSEAADSIGAVAAIDSDQISKGEGSDLSDIHVLLVEDSPDNQNLVRRILAKRNAKVSVASNGLEGLEKARSGDHDIVLMDVQMPVMDGYTAVQKLRASGYKKPIIALTAHAMAEVHHRCLEVGCSDFLSKPIDSRLLVEKVARYAHEQIQ